MTFQTSIPIQKSDFLINYSSKLVSFGSCFAENMSDKFDYFKFQNTTNPFGIIFNPVAIEKIIARAIHLIYFTENELFFRPGGHGALIENLNQLQSDIVFIKNIDNVSQNNREVILTYKKLLGGILLHTKQEVDTALKKLKNKETIRSSFQMQKN